MSNKKPYWMEVSHLGSEYLEKHWFIPHDIAIKPNNHFYVGDVEAFIENFDLIAFLHAPDDKTQVIFRFWTVNEQSLVPDWDLFTGYRVGWLSLSHKALKELIGLVQQHTQDLVDIPEPVPIFQSMPDKEDLEYMINRTPSAGFYLHNTAQLRGVIDPQETDTFLTLSGLGDVFIKTTQAPKGVNDTKSFRRAMDNSNGSLTLTKRGGEELCGILQKYL